MKRIRHRRIECVSCAYCVENAPAYWRMDEDGLAVLNLVESDWGEFTFTSAFADDVDALREIADACPAGIISVE